jgi:hypothetical protein
VGSNTQETGRGQIHFPGGALNPADDRHITKITPRGTYLLTLSWRS